MIKPKPFIVTVVLTAALATPAFAQWQSQEPAGLDRNHASPATSGSIASAPSAKSPRPTVIRATKGQ
jgi:hypothetical protein